MAEPIAEIVEKDLKEGFLKHTKRLLRDSESLNIIREVDEMLSDPEMRKSYDQYVAQNMADYKSTIQNLMAIMFDVELPRNTINDYDFPFESVNYRTLRNAGRSLPAQLIKSYRYNQIMEFAKISDGKNPGFNITLLDRQKTLKSSQKKICEQIENYVANKFFFVPNNEFPSMSAFLHYAYNDIFDLDKIAIEIIREKASFNQKFNNRGKPLALSIIDAGIVYPIIPKVEGVEQQNTFFRDFYRPVSQRQYKEQGLGYKTYFQDEYRYGMVDRQLKLVALYTPEKMIFNYFFGTTDIENQFRGYSVAERSLNVMRYIIDSITYNTTRRSANAMPKGMIAIVGATEDGFSRDEMTLFRKLIWGISMGQKDKWKYPVVGVPKGVDPKFIRFHESSREMEDFLWMATLFSWMCTFEGIDPEDISMSSNKNAIGKRRLFDKQEEEGPMVRSQDPGLRRYLNNMADLMNNYGLFEEMSGIEGVGLVWSGLDVEDQSKKLEIDLKRLQTTASINDLLIENDKNKFELSYGDVNIFDIPGVGNPQILQLINNALMLKQQQAQAEEEPNEGEEPEYDEFPNWEEEEEGGEEENQLGKGLIIRKSLLKDMQKIRRIQKSKNGNIRLSIKYK